MQKNYQDSIKSVLVFLLAILIVPFNIKFLLSQPLFFILLLILIASFIWSKLGKPFEKKLHTYKVFFITGVSALVVLSLYGSLVQAKWGQIDDHEIMHYLGEDGQMKLDEWPGLIAQSEAAKPGKILRYRPSYQSLRLFETALWDNHPELWYTTRIIIFIFFLSVVWYLVLPLTGLLGGGLLIGYLFSYDYWKDIWARLGPSEAYSVLGLGLYALFFQKIFLSKNPKKIYWLGLLIGGIIAIGAKENMVLLLLPTLLLWFSSIKKKSTSLFGHLTLAFITAFSLFVAGAVVVATNSVGHDVYSASTTATSRTAVLITSLKTHQAKQLIMSCGLLFVFLCFIFFKIKNKLLLKKTFIVLSIQASLLVFFISQFVFYNGNWPDHNRYDFPGMLYEPVYYLSLVWYLQYLLPTIKLEQAISTGLKWAAFTAIIVTIVMRGFVSTQVYISENVQKTQGYTKAIQSLSEELKKNPTVPVVFESELVWDYEPIFSYEIFLRSHGVTNPFYLRLSNYTSETVSPGLEKNLAQQLEKIQREGNALFHPLEDLDENNCYSLIISGKPQTACQLLN